MKKRYLLLLALICILTLVACNQEIPDQKHNNSDIANGKWELVDPAYDPVAVDLSETLHIPDTYNGKTIKELWDYAYQFYNGGRYPEGFDITWAGSPIISPDSKKAAYRSNKNCIEVNGLSVFVLDIDTRKEIMLLGNSISREYYNTVWWLDNDTLVCENPEQKTRYILCDLNGNTTPIKLKGNNPMITAWNGKYILYTPEWNSNTRYVASIKNNKLFEEGVIQCPEGYLAHEGAISSDGSKVALKIYTDKTSSTRIFAIYDMKTNKLYKISNPDIEGSDVIAAIDMRWSNRNVEVNFYTSKNEVEHNELWRYEF